MANFGFTPASQQDVFSIETGQSRFKTAIMLSGEEARQFYENLMNDGTGQDGSRRENSRKDGREHQIRQSPIDSVVQRGIRGEREDDQRRDTSTSESSAELMGLRLLRCAHEGDISGIKELLSKGVDINFQDTFFWTAVMCASWSGQRTALRLLLDHGAAWVGVVDTRGKDAKDLAQEAGHSEVLEELLNYGRSTQRETRSNSRNLQPQWCEVCHSDYSCSLSSHLSSTLHQFSLGRPPTTPYYCLPPSSNSYKMMVRCGWKPGTGLGPEGEGPKQPVPTVLKRDQKGLGYGQMTRAKVTHFKARDGDAVKPLSREKEERGQRRHRKEETKKKEQKDKNWERDFRASFYL